MKNISTLILLSIIAITTQSCIVSTNAKTEYLKNIDYKDKNSKIITVNVPLLLTKPFIKSALRKDGESKEVIALVKKIKKVKVITVENPKLGTVNSLKSKLNNYDFEEWMTIKHNGENVNINVQQKDDIINKLLLIVNSNEELVMIDVKAKIKADELSQLINKVETEQK